MKLTKFDGGLRLKPDPHLIGPNEAREHVNINVDKGTLTPLKDKLPTDIAGATPYGAFYVKENRFVFFDTPTDTVEYQNRLYFTDRIGTPKKIIDGITYEATIEKPETNIASANTGAADLDGTYTWAATFYNVEDGSESAPATSNELVITNNSVTLTVGGTDDPQVDRIRLYRVGGANTLFSLVKEYNITPGSASYTITDDTGDAAIIGSALPTADVMVGKAGLSFLTESYAMLFAAHESRLYFTGIDRPWSWPALQFLAFPRPITAIGITPNGLLVCTRYKTYLVTGSGPATLSQQVLSSDQGATSHDGMQNVRDAAIWPSLDGICSSSGGNVEIVTKSRLERVAFDITSSAMYNQKYYAHLANNSTLIIDFDTAIFQYADTNIVSVLQANDKLYGFKDGELHELFAANTPLSWKWRSPTFIGVGYTSSKLYKHIRAYTKGKITLTVFVDNKQALKTELQDGLNELKIDISRTRGYDISFYAEGTGEILELAWMEADPNA